MASKLSFGWIGALVLGTACSSEIDMAGPGTPRSYVDTNVDPNGPGNGGGPATEGLPCEVADVLSMYCISCHGDPPVADAPSSLLSRADLLSTATDGQTLAALALARMRSSTDPMPPSGAGVPDAMIASFEAWVTAGMPEGSCGSIEDPFAGPVVCTSERYWTSGNEESPNMHPGRACIDCHENGGGGDDEGEGPRFSIAGTVYPTGHEPDDCNGVDGSALDSAKIEVIDGDGISHVLDVNRAGNFYMERNMRFPITARVLFEGRERVMQMEQDSGDCNSCHTVAGKDDAPGRILLP